MWLRGLLGGELVWILAIAGAYLCEAIEPYFPGWLEQLDLFDTVGSICSVLAAPIPLGGWLLIWGDNGPPYPWIESLAFNLAFGIAFYGIGGIIFAEGVAKARRAFRRRKVQASGMSPASRAS